jgi:hypothetical protein
MTDIPMQAIRRVLDYLHDERKHFESNPSDDHIYRSIKVVEEWIASGERFRGGRNRGPRCS